MSTSTPLVSVILPTYRRPHLLGRAMRSVLAQSYRNLELIVVDDASPDDTAERVAACVDPRVRYFRQDHNSGASAARNRGIREAQGEYLAFQDDDDVWLLDRLAAQVQQLESLGAGHGLSLAAHISLTPEGAKYVGGPDAFRRIDFARGVRNDFGLIATPCWLLRRRLLDEVGSFDEQLKTWEDWELALRLSRVTRLAHLETPGFLQDRRQHGGLRNLESAFAGSMRIVLAKHGALWQHDPAVSAHHQYLIGRWECLHGSPAVGRAALWAALRLQPSLAKAWAFAALSLTGARGVEWALRAVSGLHRLRRGSAS